MSSRWLNANNLGWGHERVASGAATVLAVGIALLVGQAIRNLVFHPLSKVPGPKLAAVTNVWRYTYEIKGVLPFKLKEIQYQNGWPPIMRTGPNQVVIHDPAEFDVIYRVNSPFMKDRVFYEMATSGRSGGTTVTTCDKKVHASRRKDTMGQLSKQKVVLLQPLVEEKLATLLGHVQRLSESGRSVNVLAAWKCYAMDIISEYAFGQCVDALRVPNFESDMVRTLERFVRSFLLLVALPSFMFDFLSLPPWRDYFPGVKAVKDMFRWANQCVVSFRPDKDKPCILNALMDPARPEKLTVPQLESEAEDILLAGTDTTALTLTYACVHLARQPQLWEDLYREIRPVYGEPDGFPQLRALESLPLLSACIKESLRMATPSPTYLWRTVPAEGYIFAHGSETYHIPAGTSIGMSAWNTHYNEGIFPDPHEFRPSRWLGSSDELDRYLVAFSKGTRGCGGINLAYLEMYQALATMVVRFRVKGEAEPGKPMMQRELFIGLLTDPVWNIYYEPRTNDAKVA